MSTAFLKARKREKKYIPQFLDKEVISNIGKGHFSTRGGGNGQIAVGSEGASTACMWAALQKPAGEGRRERDLRWDKEQGSREMRVFAVSEMGMM